MLKVLSLNLNYYVDKHGSWDNRKALIAELIKENNFDIIAFQAVCSDPSVDSGKNQARQFCELLPQYTYSLFTPVSRQESGRQEGNAIIAKYPFHEAENYMLTLLPGTDDSVQRLIQKVRFNLPNGPFYLFNAHFSWVGEQTDQNVKDAIPYLNSVSHKALLVGDFNADAKEVRLNPFEKAGWSDTWKLKKGTEDGFTFESNKPFTRIDYAWVNSQLKNGVVDISVVQKEKEGTVRLSDHLGLAVTIAD